MLRKSFKNSNTLTVLPKLYALHRLQQQFQQGKKISEVPTHLPRHRHPQEHNSPFYDFLKAPDHTQLRA